MQYLRQSLDSAKQNDMLSRKRNLHFTQDSPRGLCHSRQLSRRNTGSKLQGLLPESISLLAELLVFERTTFAHDTRSDGQLKQPSKSPNQVALKICVGASQQCKVSFSRRKIYTRVCKESQREFEEFANSEDGASTKCCSRCWYFWCNELRKDNTVSIRTRIPLRATTSARILTAGSRHFGGSHAN